MKSKFCNWKKTFEYFIRESDFCLRTDEYIVVHLDGVEFTHKYYRKFDSDIKSKVVKALAESAKEMCLENSSIRIAYAYSDEVSFILEGKDIAINDNNRINKIVSKFASRLTLNFYRKIVTLNLTEHNEFVNHAIFAAKAYNLPQDKIETYLKWRLEGCKKTAFGCNESESFDKKEAWEKFGYLITKGAQWEIQILDFTRKKLQKSPQNVFFHWVDNDK